MNSLHEEEEPNGRKMKVQSPERHIHMMRLFGYTVFPLSSSLANVVR